MRQNNPPPYWFDFYTQRTNAKKRGIKWKLSYNEWINIWTRSKKLAKRGRNAGCYVMSRFGDKGPYSVGNVEIVPVTKNNHDAHQGRRNTERHNRNIAKAVSMTWASMAPDEHAARGRAISEAQLRTGSQQKAWDSTVNRKQHRQALRKAWANLTPEQRAARGRAISEGKRRRHVTDSPSTPG
jgi:hypothetical protein